MDDAITAISASPGASSGVGTSSRCSERRGSFSFDGRPANMSASSLWTVTPRYDSGTGMLANSSAGASLTIASRIRSMSGLRFGCVPCPNHYARAAPVVAGRAV